MSWYAASRVLKVTFEWRVPEAIMPAVLDWAREETRPVKTHKILHDRHLHSEASGKVILDEDHRNERCERQENVSEYGIDKNERWIETSLDFVTSDSWHGFDCHFYIETLSSTSATSLSRRSFPRTRLNVCREFRGPVEITGSSSQSKGCQAGFNMPRRQTYQPLWESSKGLSQGTARPG